MLCCVVLVCVVWCWWVCYVMIVAMFVCDVWGGAFCCVAMLCCVFVCYGLVVYVL